MKAFKVPGGIWTHSSEEQVNYVNDSNFSATDARLILLLNTKFQIYFFRQSIFYFNTGTWYESIKMVLCE